MAVAGHCGQCHSFKNSKHLFYFYDILTENPECTAENPAKKKLKPLPLSFSFSIDLLKKHTRHLTRGLGGGFVTDLLDGTCPRPAH